MDERNAKGYNLLEGVSEGTRDYNEGENSHAKFTCTGVRTSGDRRDGEPEEG